MLEGAGGVEAGEGGGGGAVRGPPFGVAMVLTGFSKFLRTAISLAHWYLVFVLVFVVVFGPQSELYNYLCESVYVDQATTATTEGLC